MAVLVVEFLGLIGNATVTWYCYSSRHNTSSAWRRHVVLILAIAAIVHLVAVAPLWDATRRYDWAKVLRAGEYVNNAHHIDEYRKIGMAIIIFWSIIDFFCLGFVLVFRLVVYCQGRPMISFWG